MAKSLLLSVIFVLPLLQEQNTGSSSDGKTTISNRIIPHIWLPTLKIRQWLHSFLAKRNQKWWLNPQPRQNNNVSTQGETSTTASYHFLDQKCNIMVDVPLTETEVHAKSQKWKTRPHYWTLFKPIRNISTWPLIFWTLLALMFSVTTLKICDPLCF